MSATETQAAFRAQYAAHRASEGRALDETSLRALPYLRRGPVARQWAVRARTFDAFLRDAVRPMCARVGRTLDVLDLGAGNGWLSWRLACDGHSTLALDLRDDRVDGLGAAQPFADEQPQRLQRIAASFESLPLADAQADLVVFNASLHYALDLTVALAEARRVLRPGGTVAILDSPFYEREVDGMAMVEEKRRNAAREFGHRAPALMEQAFVEFLTTERLAAASRDLGISWRRHPVHYPLWYEMRPIVARLRRARTPSRFDYWLGVVS